MSSLSARLVPLADSGYGDQDQDANTALFELDKGLRSTKVGEQCDAIVRFARLFEKYPFPILINSAFLKLADVFRTGSNFLRLCVLKVTQQTEKHLDKILNVDEFTKRIFMVIHSNDPVARALTLRTLGSIACVIPEKKNVHHSIINSLDSHDPIELDASIYAANKFAEQSKSFTISIYQKLGAMIEGLETPVEIKLKLIPIFQYMYHDIGAATKVRELCTRLLPNYPARKFVLTILHTLTQLSSKSIMDIQHQIDLLLHYLHKDPRSVVKVRALQDLRMLAVQGPHMWTKDTIDIVLTYIGEESRVDLRLGAMMVLATLSSTVAVTCFDMSEGSSLLTVCVDCCYHDNKLLAGTTCKLLTYLAVHAQKMNLTKADSVSQEASIALEALLYVTTAASTIGIQEKKALKGCLQSVISLCMAFPVRCKTFVDTLITILTGVSGPLAVTISESLAAIGDFDSASIGSVLPDITSLLQQSIQSNQQDLAVGLSTLVFQATSSSGIGQESQQTILDLSQSTNGWVAYKIARQAARYAHHSVASKIFDRLTTKVSSEHYLFWLGALRDFCAGEHCIQGEACNFIQSLTQAMTYYHRGLSALRAASIPINTLKFHCDYIKLHIQTLQAHAQLYRVVGSFRSCPPPAIAAVTSGHHRGGHIVSQLEKCSREYKNITGLYVELYQSLFDGDPQTIDNIQQLQLCSEFMAHIIDGVLEKTTSDSSRYESAKGVVGQVLNQITTNFRTVLKGSASLNHQTISCLVNACQMITQIPYQFPRYFFQSLQSTSIKLAISPQARSLSELVTLQTDVHLTLKVEGVIQHSTHEGIFRKVDKVQIGVKSNVQSRSLTLPDAKPQENPGNDMKNVCDPHNDYFSCQFLLAFPVAGLHTVNIETSVTDEDGVLWKTGPQSTLMVKSYDEQARIQQHQQQQYARSQQRAAAFKP